MNATEVVIPDLDGGALLDRCLDSLETQTVSPFRVIIVDNGSVTPVSERVAGRGLPIEVIRLDRNHGFAAAVNRGIEAVTSSRVAVLNNDVVLDSRWIEIVTRELDAGERIAACQSLILTPDGRVDGAGVDISDGTVRQLGHGLDPEDLDPDQAVTVSATATVYRMEALNDRRSDRWFDERFESYYEDVELGLGLLDRGWSFVVVGEPLAVHEGSASADRIGRGHRTMIMRRNRYFLATLYPHRLSRWPLFLEDIRLACRSMLHLDPGGAFSVVRGAIAGLTTRLEPAS